MYRWRLALLTLTLALTACAPAAVPPPTATAPLPEAPATNDPQLAARQALAAYLNLPLERITLIGSEAVTWPDSCLGIPRLEARCAMMITPGFRIDLEADGQPAVVHTNQDGSGVAVVETLLTWERQGGIAGFCDELRLTPAGVLTARNCRPAGAEQTGALTAVLTEDEARLWHDWLTRWGSVVLVREDPAAADQMRLALTFTGRGQAQPTEAEQQALFDLAQSLYQRLQP